MLCRPPSPSGGVPPGRSSCSLASGTEDKGFHDGAPVLQAPCAHMPPTPKPCSHFSSQLKAPLGPKPRARSQGLSPPSLSSGILCVLTGQPRLPRFQHRLGKGAENPCDKIFLMRLTPPGNVTYIAILNTQRRISEFSIFNTRNRWHKVMQLLPKNRVGTDGQVGVLHKECSAHGWRMGLPPQGAPGEELSLMGAQREEQLGATPGSPWGEV